MFRCRCSLIPVLRDETEQTYIPYQHNGYNSEYTYSTCCECESCRKVLESTFEIQVRQDNENANPAN